MKTKLECREIRKSLGDLLDGALSPAERQGIEAHLRDCMDCREVLRELRCTCRVLGHLPREPMPDRMKATLLEALRRARPTSDATHDPHPPQPPHTRSEEHTSELQSREN